MKKMVLFAAVAAINAQAQQTVFPIDDPQGAKSRLSWEAPTERENGDELLPENIVGYIVQRMDGDIMRESLTVPGTDNEVAFTPVQGECSKYHVIATALTVVYSDEDGGSDEGEILPVHSKPSNTVEVCMIPPERPTNIRVR